MPSASPNISFWERQFLSQADIIVIGAGIVGLQCAHNLKLKYPHRKVWVLDRGPWSYGASMRNAGFACFGSVGEILDDAERTSFDEALRLYERRYKGIHLLLQKYSAAAIGHEVTGGFEIFAADQADEAQHLISKMDVVNVGLREVTQSAPFVARNVANTGMRVLPEAIYTPFEGALQTHLLYRTIRNAALASGVEIFTGIDIQSFESKAAGWLIYAGNGVQLSCRKLVVCTNGFTQKLLPELDIQPARGQVLVTSHIPDLAWRGLMHTDKGYIYFRSLGTRILIGGARNTDFEGEHTMDIDINQAIQDRLVDFLRNTVVPNATFEITDAWSGIMGMAQSRHPIVKEHLPGLYVCARMGGMGVALSALVSEELAAMVQD